MEPRGRKKAIPVFVSGDTRRLPQTVPSYVSISKRILTDIGDDKETLVVNAAVSSIATDKDYKLFFCPVPEFKPILMQKFLYLDYILPRFNM